MSALDTVDQFYCNNYSTLLLKLSFKSQLRDPNCDIHAGFTGHFDSYGFDYVELQHHKAAFTELVAEFDKLRWYSRVNTDGFRKNVLTFQPFDQRNPSDLPNFWSWVLSSNLLLLPLSDRPFSFFNFPTHCLSCQSKFSDLMFLSNCPFLADRGIIYETSQILSP